MKRIISVFALSFVLIFAANAQVATTFQHTSENLSKKQLNSLIATAKTPSEHRRISQYFEAKAEGLLAESKEHQAMADQYRQTGAFNTKWASNTIGHCEYFAKHLREESRKMQKLAEEHEVMAKNAQGN